MFAGAILVAASSFSVQAQTNSAVIPSASGATTSAPPGGETSKPAANQAAHHKKKKSSFMHKMRDKAHNMRDKAMEKVQKMFGPKPKPESNVE